MKLLMQVAIFLIVVVLELVIMTQIFLAVSGGILATLGIVEIVVMLIVAWFIATSILVAGFKAFCFVGLNF